MKHLRRACFSLLTVAIAVVSFSGCSDVVLMGEPIPYSSNSSEVLDGNLYLTGSTSMQEVCDALSVGFMGIYPDIKVSKGGNGSGEAPAAVKDGIAQIGDLSREMKQDERPEDFSQRKIAVDGIALAINEKNAIHDLTKNQIAQIYEGKITDWSQLGGNSGHITVIGRDSASGTRESFESIFEVDGKCKYSVELNSTGEVKSKLQSDPGAIGYVSFGSIDSSVVALKINGVAPTEENVIAGQYTVFRPFLQITKKNSSDEFVDAWFDYVYSPEGQRIISSVKLIPIPEQSG